MKTATIKIQNMHCAGCVRNVENALSQIKGVYSAKANLEKGSVTIQYDEKLDLMPIFLETLEEWGYPEIKE